MWSVCSGYAFAIEFLFLKAENTRDPLSVVSVNSSFVLGFVLILVSSNHKGRGAEGGEPSDWAAFRPS